MSIFEYATRNKLRFPYRGEISAEDLWDLDVKKLDSIYKTLNAEVKKESEESLLTTVNTKDEELTVKIEIIKHIVSVKLAEAEAAEKAAERKATKEKILSIIATKKDEALANSSVEDLEKMLADLG